MILILISLLKYKFTNISSKTWLNIANKGSTSIRFNTKMIVITNKYLCWCCRHLTYHLHPLENFSRASVLAHLRQVYIDILDWRKWYQFHLSPSCHSHTQLRTALFLPSLGMLMRKVFLSLMTLSNTGSSFWLYLRSNTMKSNWSLVKKNFF